MLKVVKQTNGSPEIFFSVQGEGVNMGRPSAFLRLAHCNLACAWCDTRYAWDWKTYNPAEMILDMSTDDVTREILRYNCKTLVVTGGEPLLQQKELLPLLRQLKQQGFFIEVETNGTIFPSGELIELIGHWSVSPKLETSGNAKAKREIQVCYDFFATLPSTHLKFVVRDNTDLAEIYLLAQRYNISPGRIILMPEAQTADVLIEKSHAVVEYCKTHGYLFSTRLQVLLWGARRGI